MKKNTHAELAIVTAVKEVQNMGNDTKLTLAVIKLEEAHDIVCKYIKEVEDEDCDDRSLMKLPESESNCER